MRDIIDIYLAYKTGSVMGSMLGSFIGIGLIVVAICIVVAVLRFICLVILQILLAILGIIISLGFFIGFIVSIISFVESLNKEIRLINGTDSECSKVESKYKIRKGESTFDELTKRQSVMKVMKSTYINQHNTLNPLFSLVKIRFLRYASLIIIQGFGYSAVTLWYALYGLLFGGRFLILKLVTYFHSKTNKRIINSRAIIPCQDQI